MVANFLKEREGYVSDDNSCDFALSGNIAREWG